MSEPKIVEAVGHGRANLRSMFDQMKAPIPQPTIQRVRLVKKDAQGNVIEDLTVDYGNHR